MVVVAALVTTGIAVFTGDSPGGKATADGSSSPAATLTQVTAPTAPPAKICGNAKALSGPAQAPAGAVVVNAGQNLDTATESNPAGTTFWLSAGTHKLGNGPYAQVIPKDGNTYRRRARGDPRRRPEEPLRLHRLRDRASR